MYLRLEKASQSFHEAFKVKFELFLENNFQIKQSSLTSFEKQKSIYE